MQRTVLLPKADEIADSGSNSNPYDMRDFADDFEKHGRLDPEKSGDR
jgi:hypothetical protein